MTIIDLARHVGEQAQRQRDFAPPNKTETRLPIRMFLIPGIAAGAAFAAVTEPFVLGGSWWLILGQSVTAVCIAIGLALVLAAVRPKPMLRPSTTGAVRTPTVLPNRTR